MDDPMDWEGHSTAQVQNTAQAQCPYNATEATNSGIPQFNNSQPAAFNQNMPFNQTHGPTHAFWNNIMQQNEGYHPGTGSRFPIYPTSNMLGRAPGTAGIGFQAGVDGQERQEQSHSSPLTSRQSRFEAPRLPTQRNSSYQAGPQQNSGVISGNGLSGGPNSLAPPAAQEFPSSHNAMLGRRAVSANDNAHENGPTPLVTPPRPHLPPPNSAYHDYHFQPNLPFPSHPRFSGPPSFGHHTMPGHPPQPRDRPFSMRPESGSHPSQRDLFYDAFRAVQHPDADSDGDSSLDSQSHEDTARREVLLSSGVAFRHLQESMHLSSDTRRSIPLDGEQHGLGAERARAARRAAAISVKMVASTSALAALEKVDLATLKGDDRSCIICYNDFGVKNPDGFIESPVRLPKCKHVFGDRCLKQWLQDSDSCPYCRDKLPSEPKRNRPDDFRRLLVQAHAAQGQPLDLINYPWPSDPSRMHPAYSGLEQQQRHQQHQTHHRNFRPHTDEVQDYIYAMQYRSARRHPDDADDFLARLSRHDDYNWGDSNNQTSPGHLARSMPDYDGRRRFRGRHSVSRTISQVATRPNGQNPARSTRNSNPPSGPTRTQIHGSTPQFDDSTTSQRRSVTPHPTLVGVPTWTSQPQSSPAASERPSALPTERPAPGDPNETARDVFGPRTPNSSTIVTTQPLERSWSEANNVSVEPFNGWVNSGRPVSATFINEMPQTRLHQFENGINSTDNSVQNNRFTQHYMTNPSNNEFQGGFAGRH